MNIDRNLYFSDINNKIENKVFYNDNNYKPAVMPSQTEQPIKKEYIYIAIASISIIILYNINK